MAVHNCKLSFLSRSDGSAYYSLGDTTVLVSVHGPGDVKISNRLHNSLYLDVHYIPKIGNSNVSERNMESFISQTVKQTLLSHFHPRTAITLTIQEMQSSGLLLSAGVNGACLALLDAGIQMKTAFAAVTCCITSDNVYIVEPTEIEIKESLAVITFVFEGTNLNVLTTCQEGILNVDQFASCLKKCQVAAKDIFSFYRRIIEEKYFKYYNHFISNELVKQLWSFL